MIQLLLSLIVVLWGLGSRIVKSEFLRVRRYPSSAQVIILIVIKYSRSSKGLSGSFSKLEIFTCNESSKDYGYFLCPDEFTEMSNHELA